MTRRTQIGAAKDSGVYKDWMKEASGLRSTAGYDFPALMTVDQYPTSGANITEGIYRSVAIPAFYVWGTTEMVFRWTGTMNGSGAGTGGFLNFACGTIDQSATAGTILLANASNMFVYGTNGRILFKFDPTQDPRPASVTFAFFPGDSSATFSITRLMLSRVSDETDAWANASPESIITDEYKEIYTRSGVKTFRPMGWAGINAGMVSQERYRHRWDTGFGFSSGIWMPGAWVGTIAGTNTKTCSPGTDYLTGPYVNGELVQGRVASASTDLCTLNVVRTGSSGAKPIFDVQGELIGDTDPFEVAPIPAFLNTFVYNTILGGWVAHNQSNFIDGQGGGIECADGPPWPLAMRVAMCNACDMDYWHNFDFLTDDTSVTEQVEYIRDNLAAGKTCTIEYSNEVWNPQFAQFGLAASVGEQLGFSDGGVETNFAEQPRRFGWYGLRSKQIIDLANAAWSPRDPDELIPYFGFQISTPADAGEPVKYGLLGENLTSSGNASYAALVGVDYNVEPDRPVDVAKAVGAAPYWGGTMVLQFSAWYGFSFIAEYDSAILAGYADDWATGTTEEKDAALQWFDRDMRGIESGGYPVWLDFTMFGYRTGTLQGSASGDFGYPGMKALADRHGLICKAYEGGWALEPPSTAVCTSIGLDTSYGGLTGKIADLIDGWRASEYARITCREYMQEQMDAGWVEPSWLLFTGAPAGNPWGIWKLDPMDPGVDPQKAMDAIIDINFGTVIKGFNTRLR